VHLCVASVLALALHVRHCKKQVTSNSTPAAFASIRRRHLVVPCGGAVGCVSNVGSVRAEPVPNSEVLNLKQIIAENGLEGWKNADYEAMRDDVPRTSKFENAIKRRLAGSEGQTVVDIGTGPFALLAVIAARAGARKVYAIEKNPEAAQQAKDFIRREKLDGKIEIIEGDSMQVELPEKVDLIVSELIGSIATQEGVEAIIRDAGKRFLKTELAKIGGSCGQMIPTNCQTLIAPVKYTEHRIIKFKRGIMSRGKPEPGTLRPLRLKSNTRDLVFLAPPQVLEDFDYCNPGGDDARRQEKVMTFDMAPEAANDAKDFSGFAMWTRVVVDESELVDVKTQKGASHWAYVVALMSPGPVALKAPSSIQLRASIDYAATPVRYALDANVHTLIA